MNISPLKFYLQRIAEDQAPPQAIDLVSGIHQKYLARAAIRRQRHTALLVVGALIVLVGVALATPPGKALANRLFHFFVVGTGNTCELPTLSAALVEGTAESSTAAQAQVQNPVFYDVCGSFSDPYCSPQELQSMVSFSVREPASLPDGMAFQGATGGPGAILLRYIASHGQESLLIYEIPWDGPFPAQEIGAGAVVQNVQIGPAQGEYVQGAWNSQLNAAVWQSDDHAQNLRWEADGIFYAMIFFSNSEEPASLDKADLVSLAASLKAAGSPDSQTAIAPGLLSIQAAEAEAGHSLLLPVSIPDGYRFSGASVVDGEVCLHYQYREGGTIAGLHIAERTTGQPANLGVDRALSPDAVLEEQFVPVGGAQGGIGLYAWGSPQVSDLCNPNEDSHSQTALLFKTNQMTFEIYGPPVEIMTRLEMVRLAEQLTGVQTTSGLADPQRISSPEEAQAYVNFTIQQPTQLPEGWYFHGAKADLALDQVTLYYYAGQGALVYGSFSVRQTKMVNLAEATLPAGSVPAGAIEPVKIGDLNAEFLQGCLLADANGEPAWNADCSSQKLTWQVNGIAYRMEAGLDPRVGKEILTAVAQSLADLSTPEEKSNLAPQNTPHLLESFSISTSLNLPEPYSTGDQQIILSTATVCQSIHNLQSESTIGYFMQSLAPLSIKGSSVGQVTLQNADNHRALIYTLHNQDIPGCAKTPIQQGIYLVWQRNGIYYQLVSTGVLDENNLIEIAEEISQGN